MSPIDQRVAILMEAIGSDSVELKLCLKAMLMLSHLEGQVEGALQAQAAITADKVIGKAMQ